MFARTDRLLLRPGWREDAPALARAVSALAVARNLEGLRWPYSVEEAERFLAHAAAQPGQTTLLAFRRAAGAPELVGAVGLGRSEDGHALFAAWIAPDYRGRGYASEAGSALLAAARDSLRLPRLFAWSFLGNPAGARMLDKLGFTATGEILRAAPPARSGAAAPCRLHVMNFASAPASADRHAALAA